MDFYVATGRAEFRGQVVAWLSQYFGKPERHRGRYLYADRLRWANGTEVNFSEDGEAVNAGTFCVSIPGGALDEWGPAERVDLLHELYEVGATRPRRVDLPVDYRGHGLQLIHEIREGVARGEGCGFRRSQDVKDVQGLRLRGDTVYLGKRGNGGVSVCVYDKGLEQSKGKGKPGEWVRWEARFEGEAAQAVMCHLWAAREYERSHEAQQLSFSFEGWGSAGEPVDTVARGWEPEYASLSLGCVDFRAVSGGKSRSLRRRARCEWWTAWVAWCEPRRSMRHRRRYACLRGHADWLRRCVFPGLLGMAERAGQDVVDVLEVLGLGRARVGGRRQVVDEYACRLQERVA